jgi:hypothetical protein
MAEVGVRGGGLLEKRLAELAKKVRNPGTLRVGFLEDAKYPDGESVATVAATQNFGAPGAGIPARPFFSNMVAQNSASWGPILAHLLEVNEWDAVKSLEAMGEVIAGELREAIINMNAPELSEVTLMLRKMKRDDPTLVVTAATVGDAAQRVAAGETSGLSGTAAKPLVDTGHMLASIDYEVTPSNG